MNYKTYKVRQGSWNGIYTNTVTLPSDIKLITGGDTDAGSMGLHKGLNHYIGVYKGKETTFRKKCDGLQLRVIPFDIYCFITIHDIDFIDDKPDIVTAEEFNKQVDWSTYLIANYSEDYRLVDMVRITAINSEFNVEYQFINNTAHYINEKIIRLGVERTDLTSIMPSYNNNGYSKLVSGCIAEKYWDTLLHNTLLPFNVGLNGVRDVDVDYSYTLWKQGETGVLLQDTLNMKTYKRLTQ
jgi:hypothetical protein